jgi:hypothetical protein
MTDSARALMTDGALRNVVMAIATNRPIPKATQDCVQAVIADGAILHTIEGSSDVAFARNIQLSLLVHTFQADATRDVALLVDDDMVFSLDQARRLCAYAKLKPAVCSGIYATAIGELAASTQWSPFPDKWLTGLGFFAIPRAALLALADNSPAFQWRGQTLWQFTQSSLHIFGVDMNEPRWIGEDYWLCVRFGGVDLLPLAIGHLKQIPLYPDEETVRRVREGEPLQLGGVHGAPFRVMTSSGSERLTVEQKPERQK